MASGITSPLMRREDFVETAKATARHLRGSDRRARALAAVRTFTFDDELQEVALRDRFPGIETINPIDYFDPA